MLISAVTEQIKLRSPFRDIIYGAIYRSDFASWLTATVTSPAKTPLPITFFGHKSNLSQGDQEWLSEFTQTTQPTSLRRVGMRSDIDKIGNLEPIQLDQISIPTLIVHALDDAIVPIDHAYHAHQHIPSAELLVIPSGGHLLIGHHEMIEQRVVNFLHEHSANPL